MSRAPEPQATGAPDPGTGCEHFRIGSMHLSEPLATIVARLALAGVEPPLELDDWAFVLKCSRREVERMKSSGKLPAADFHVGRMPRWRPATVRGWLKGGS